MPRAFLLIFLLGLGPRARGTDCDPTRISRETSRRLYEFDPIEGDSRQKEIAVLEHALALHPNDVFLHRSYQQLARRETRSERNTMIERYKQLSNLHSGSAEYTFLYANALVDSDTPQAISLYKQALAASPPYPLAHLGLAYVYEWGKFADHAAGRSELDAFYSACPNSLDTPARFMLESDANQEMAAKYSAQFRARLSKERDPDLLPAWRTVWNLEFKAHPPNEHDAVRKQIQADLDRLQRGRQPKDVRWLETLQNGYHLLGDEAGQDRIGDRILAEFPNSFEARETVRTRWYKKHPFPKEEDSDESRQAYYRARLQFAEDQLKKTPNDFEYISARFDALSELDSATPAQIEEVGEALRNGNKKSPGWFRTPPYEFQIAKAYVKKSIRLDEVPQLIEEGWQSHRHNPGNELSSDRATEDFGVNQRNADLYVQIEAANILLDTSAKLHNPLLAENAVAQIAELKPEKAHIKSQVWSVKAKWAELNGHKLDALLMYREALALRGTDFKPRGKQADELSDGFARLWKELGGTSGTQGFLAAAKIETATDDRWEQPGKALPTWRLADLQGNIWTAESLKGKALLVNVWATWCGPCRGEHPDLQKLYDELKNKPEVQVLTFNIDDEIGGVAPYMEENKYTFPVILAKDYVNDLLSSIGIPQNWIIDKDGVWRWTELGFASAAEWRKAVLEKLGLPAKQ